MELGNRIPEKLKRNFWVPKFLKPEIFGSVSFHLFAYPKIQVAEPNSILVRVPSHEQPLLVMRRARWAWTSHGPVGWALAHGDDAG